MSQDDKKMSSPKYCECVRGKKVGFEELDEKDRLPSVGWVVGCGWGC